jgi:hypothetical protein
MTYAEQLRAELKRIREELIELGEYDDNDYQEEEEFEEYYPEHSVSGASQGYSDRSEYAREMMRSGKWCEVQAAEFSVGA